VGVVSALVLAILWACLVWLVRCCDPLQTVSNPGNYCLCDPALCPRCVLPGDIDGENLLQRVKHVEAESDNFAAVLDMLSSKVVRPSIAALRGIRAPSGGALYKHVMGNNLPDFQPFPSTQPSM